MADNIRTPSFLRKTELPKAPLVIGREEEEEEKTAVPEVMPAPEPVEPPAEPMQQRTPSFLSIKQDSVPKPIEKATGPLPEAPVEEEPSISAEEIRNDPERMAKVRGYMVLRKGVAYEGKEDEEVYDDFIKHMRWFNVNEVSTVGELRFVSQLPDDQKPIAVGAYETFDELGSFLTNDGVVGAIQGVGDYVGAVLLSPSSWLGVGVGKLATSAASTTAKQAAISKLMQTASTNATQTALKKGATKSAAKQAGALASKEIVTTAARTRAVQEVVIATMVDSGASSFQDYLYQNTLIDSGYQEEYSGLQTGLAAAGGLIGGFLSAAPNLNKGSSGLGDAPDRIRAGAQRRAALDMKKAAPEMKKAAGKFQEAMVDWMKATKRGEKLAGDSLAPRRKAVELLLDTNPESETSIVAAMIRSGTALRRGADDDTIAHQLVSFARNMPEEKLAELDGVFSEATGISYREYIDIVATYARESGQGLKLFKDVGDTIGRLVAARSSSDATIVTTKVADVVKEPDAQVVQYVTSVWRRALVSHPATTAVNIQGWGQAMVARTLAETIHGGVLGTAGLVAKVIAPKSEFADQALAKSKRLFSAQVFKTKNLVDPYASREAFEALLKEAPKSVNKALNAESFGGVGMDTAARYGMDPENLIVNRVERISNKAAWMSGVKLQDVYTKSFSFLSKLDQMAKKETGKNLETIIDEGGLIDLSKEAWEAATKAALRDTFSADYTKGKGALPAIAKSIEALSNIPLVGFLFPFGRFLNNNMAFVLQYSPVAAIPMLRKATKRGFYKTSGDASIFADDNMEALSKMIVGSTALATLAMHQQQKTEEGLAWNEERSGSGSVYTVENMAPGSVYLLAGRIADLAIRGEAISGDLMRTLGDQLGISRVTRDLGSANSLDETINYMLSTFDEEADKREFMSFLKEITVSAASEIGAGFTRPLEPLSAITGVARDTDTRLDRRLLKGEPNGDLRGFLRYVDNLFVPFLGEENKEGRRTIGPARQDATRSEAVRDTNPLARVFGTREVPPANEIDVMLNKVNIAPWTVQERSEIPQWDSFLNEKITPLLNAVAIETMNSNLWKDGNQRSRERLVRTRLKEVRQQVVDFLERTGTNNERLLLERRNLLRLPESLRIQAKSALKIDTKDTELSFLEVSMIRYWAEQQRDWEKR